MSAYQEFLATKARIVPPCGFEPPALSDALFPWQADIVRWAIRRGRACLFADTGLGKTRMQLEWARRVVEHGIERALILAPLAVAAQTVAEGAKMGIAVSRCRSQADVQPGINITNYDRLHLFEPEAFDAIVLDESSCLKAEDSKTRATILSAFRHAAYRLAATATPAPNNTTELGQHSEFVGAMSAQEMGATFFVHDGGSTQNWRLKEHARLPFWRFVASWACLVRKPSDLGYSDDGYILPPLQVHEHVVEVNRAPEGFLFAAEAESLLDRIRERSHTAPERAEACAAIVNASEEQWIVWCHLNAESHMLHRLIPGSVEVEGKDSPEFKEAAAADFAAGKARVMISKSAIFGWGLNWQHCANVAFVGISDSWESYYQAVRRCWRFGQRRPVNVHVVYARTEGPVMANLKRKEGDALKMAEELAADAAALVSESVKGLERTTLDYRPKARMVVPQWLTA